MRNYKVKAMNVLVAVAILAIGLQASPARAQEATSVVAMQMAQKYGPQLVKFIGSKVFPTCNGVLQGVWRDGGKTWIAQYADGTQVANTFRSCRTIKDVTAHFAGYTHGDCDSYVVGSGEHVCYPGDVQAMVNAHGTVVAIYPY
jgi:hypothetical protein